MSHWTDAWLGLPYADGARGPHAYDCLGLARAAWCAETGRALPLADCGHDLKAWGRDVPQAQPVDFTDRTPLDWLVFRQWGGGLHVALIVDARLMLHTLQGQGSHLADYHRPYWGSRRISCYRYSVGQVISRASTMAK